MSPRRRHGDVSAFSFSAVEVQRNLHSRPLLHPVVPLPSYLFSPSCRPIAVLVIFSLLPPSPAVPLPSYLFPPSCRPIAVLAIFSLLPPLLPSHCRPSYFPSIATVPIAYPHSCLALQVHIFLVSTIHRGYIRIISRFCGFSSSKSHIHFETFCLLCIYIPSFQISSCGFLSSKSHIHFAFFFIHIIMSSSISRFRFWCLLIFA